MVQISFSENTEHSLAKITPALQVEKEPGCWMVANGGGPDPVSHTNFFEKFTLHLYKGKTSNLSSCVQGFWKNLRSPRNER